ncbi:hypothetical protein HDU92_000883, partial [Lobulomyces angularis]
MPTFQYLNNIIVQSYSSTNSTLSENLEKEIFLFLNQALVGNFQVYEDDKKIASTKCSYQFKKGEPHYVCSDCGIDDTIALCAPCFHNSVHDGHNYATRESVTGDFCDCGISAYWKVDLNCGIHKISSANVQSPPEQLIHAAQKCISTVLDFIISILSNTPFKYHSNLVESYKYPLKRGDEKNSLHFEVILWLNNLVHYSDLSNLLFISSTLGLNTEETKKLLEKVKSLGKVPIFSSSSYSDAKNFAKSIKKNGLLVTVQSVQQIFLENLMGVLIKWLSEIQNSFSKSALLGYNVNLAFTFKSVLIKCLFESPESPKPENFTFFYRESEEVFWESLESTDWPDESPIGSFRLDFFFVFFSKLWSSAKEHLIQSLISVSLNSEADGKSFALRYIHAYLPLKFNYIHHDFLNSVSLSRGLSYFILRTKSSKDLVSRTPILKNILTLLKIGYLSTILPSQFSLTTLLSQYCDSKTFTYKSFKTDLSNLKMQMELNYSYYRVFQDLVILMSSESVIQYSVDVNSSDRKLLLEDILGPYLDLCSLWNGIYPQTRLVAVDNSGSESDLDPVFSLTTKSEDLRRFISNFFKPKKPEAFEFYKDSLKFAIKAIYQWAEFKILQENDSRFMEICEGTAFKVACFEVHKQAVSVIHPLHWFFTDMLFCAPKVNFTFLESNVFQHIFSTFSSDVLPCEDTDSLVLKLIEFPLRSIVFASQVNNGSWKNNGVKVKKVVELYRSTDWRDCFDSDVLLLQIALVAIDQNRFISTLIDRFDLASVFKFENPSIQNIVDKRKLCALGELLNLITILISERLRLIKSTVEEELQNEIIHYLAASESGLTFSEVRSCITLRFSDLKIQILNHKFAPASLFKPSLEKVATFQSAVAINDSGKYFLKEHYYKSVNPYFWHYTKIQRENVLQILNKKKINKTLEIPTLEVIPSSSGFESINNVISTKCFLKVIYVSLWYLLNGSVLSEHFEQCEVNLKYILHLIKVSISLNSLQSNFLCLASQKLMSANPSCNSSTILQLLINATELKNLLFKEFISEIEFIILQFESSGYGVQEITLWKKKKEAPQNNDISEITNNKINLKARKSKLLNRFSKAQNKIFSVESSPTKTNYFEEFTVSDSISDKNFPYGTCVVCSEVANASSQFYGILSFSQPSVVQETFNFNDAFSLLENAPLNTSTVGKRIVNKSNGMQVSTCGHLIHLNCYQKFQKARGEANRSSNADFEIYPSEINEANFSCPSCRTVCNFIAPILLKEKNLLKYESLGKSKLNFNIRNTNISEAMKFNEGNLTYREGMIFNKIASNDTQKFVPKLQIPKDIKDSPDFKHSEDFEFLVSQFNSFNSTVLMSMYFVNDEQVFDDALFGLDIMIDTLSKTISSIEIKLRDQNELKLDAYSAGDFFVRLLKHLEFLDISILKVFSAGCTVFSRLISSIRYHEQNYCTRTLKLINSIFYSFLHHPIAGQKVISPILLREPFEVLVEFSMTYITINETESLDNIFCWINLFWALEIVRFLVSVIENFTFAQNTLDKAQLKDYISPLLKSNNSYSQLSNDFRSFFKAIMGFLKLNEIIQTNILNNLSMDFVLELCASLCLPFLTKTAIFLHCRFGLIYTSALSAKIGSDRLFSIEFDCLCAFLKLPNLPEFFTLNSKSDPILFKIISGWCDALTLSPNSHFFPSNNFSLTYKKSSICIPSSKKFELINLPNNRAVLAELAFRIECSNCNTVPAKQAVCLLCGTFVCFHELCCSDLDKGECNKHVESCSSGLGIFYSLATGQVLLLSYGNGMLLNYLYVDCTGEINYLYNRSTNMILNMDHMEQLRLLILKSNLVSKVFESSQDTSTINWK